MKARSDKALARKQYNLMVRAINNTAGRAVHLFIIALMEECQGKMTQTDLINAYDKWCNLLPDEVNEMKEDDVADYQIDKRISQIVNEELLQEGKQEILMAKMYSMLEVR